jgi:hypothetical protein
MRRHMRKPREITTQCFAARVAKLNAYLIKFHLFDVNQELDDMEMVDILENGVPNTWSKSLLYRV